MLNKLFSQVRSLPAQYRDIPHSTKLYLGAVFLYAAAVEGTNAVLLNLYLLRLGYGTEFIGTLNSIGLFVFAAVSLPLGAVERFSNRRMMQFGQMLSIVGLIGLPLAQFAPSMEATLLIGFRVVALIGLSAYFVHQLPFALVITAPKWHSRILALTMATFSLAAFAGSWVGGWLPKLFGRILDLPLTAPEPFQWPLIIASALIIPAVVAINYIPAHETPGITEEAPSATDSAKPKAALNGIIGLVAIVIFIRALQTSGVGVIQTFFNVYFDEALHVPTDQIGLVNGVGRLLGVPVSFLIPALVTRYGNFKLVPISLGLIALLMIPIALIPIWPIAAVAIISINSMSSLRYLAFLAFTMSLVSERQRSLMSGAGEMAIGIGFALSSLIGGYLIAWLGYRELFLFGAATTMVGTLLFWLIFRKRAAAQIAAPVAVPQ